MTYICVLFIFSIIMEDHEEIKAQTKNFNSGDCGCEGNCCPPKKNNFLSKIIFAVIIVSALGIIAFKLFYQPAPVAAKESRCPPGSSAAYDTTKTATCDTTKGSSCCPKK
jgi:hypothetical protein